MPAPEAVGERFAELAATKIARAAAANIYPLRTVDRRASQDSLLSVGNDWTRALYDGDFHLSHATDSRRPAVSLVFVQSGDGNTVADDPECLGGGDTDKHFLYEGLTRVAADGVMAGARTAGGEQVFFSVWHPELVSLRASLGLPRHPAQIVATGTGCIDVSRSLVFNVPGVPVYVLAEPGACERLEAEVRLRPWVKMIPIDQDHLAAGFEVLRRKYGIERISAVGGRTIATALLDQRLVQDIYLTTTTRPGGEPSTPFYAGKRPPRVDPVVGKRCTDPDAPFLFEHLAVSAA